MQKELHAYFKLSFPAIGFYIPISFLSFLLASSGSEIAQVRIIFSGLFLTLSITGFLIIVYLLQIFIEKVRPLRRIDIFLPIIAVGILRAALVAAFLPDNYATFLQTFYSRIPVSIFSTSLWLGLITYAIQQSKVYNEKYESLFSQAVLESVSQNPQIDTSSLKNIPEIIRLKSKVDNLLNFENIESNKVDSILRAAEAIRLHISSELRPLSHRLWVSADFQIPRVRLWNLTKDAIAELNFKIFSVLLPWCGLFLLGSLPFFSPREVISLTLVFTFVISIPLFMAKYLIARHVKGTTVLLVLCLAYLITTVSFVNVLQQIFSSEFRIESSVIFNTLTALTGVVFVVFNSSILLLNSDRKKVLQSVEDALALMRERKFTASYLHNSVQSELTAISLQLSHTKEGPLSPQVRNALERLDLLVNREIPKCSPNSPIRINQELQKIEELWQGVATLDFSEISSDGLSKLESSLLLFFIEEFVANSVRHGLANHVSLSIQVKPDLLSLVAQHNGGLPARQGSGLGFAWLNEVARDAWTISAEEGAVTIVAHIPRLI